MRVMDKISLDMPNRLFRDPELLGDMIIGLKQTTENDSPNLYYIYNLVTKHVRTCKQIADEAELMDRESAIAHHFPPAMVLYFLRAKSLTDVANYWYDDEALDAFIPSDDVDPFAQHKKLMAAQQRQRSNIHS